MFLLIATASLVYAPVIGIVEVPLMRKPRVSMAHKLPDYLIRECKRRNIDAEMAYWWGMAESSHRDYVISHKDAYGRFQITEGWLREYERITGRWRKPRPANDLLDDRFNCYLWAWTIAFWRRQGYEDATIAQIYLFGHFGHTVYGRKSEKYHKRIFND